MRSIIRYTILTAIRDWLYIGILLLASCSVFLSIFLGGTALSEQGFMATAYIGGSCRMIVVIGLILFVCFHVRRSFENKEVELILTRPISRVKFVLGYFTGFALLAFTMVLPLGIIILLMQQIGMIWASPEGIFFWAASFYMECLIVMAFAFFAALMLTSAVSSVLATFAFYFLSRIFGFFLISIHNPASLMRDSKLGVIMEQVLNFIGIFVPRLDMFSKSDWLTYGVQDYQVYLLFYSSALIYIPFLLFMALLDFVRKQF